MGGWSEICEEKTSFVVEGKNDLNARVNKSSFCEISLEPLGIDISSSNSSRPIITNVEGLLEKVEKALSFVEQSEEKEKILEYLEAVKEGEKELVIELEDPTDNSYIKRRNNDEE